MSGREHDGHEGMLSILLADEVNPRLAFRRSPLSGCDECAEELEELLLLSERFSELGTEERNDLAEATHASMDHDHQPDAERESLDAGSVLRGFRAKLDADLEDRQPESSVSDRRWVLRAVVAAIAAALVLIATDVVNRGGGGGGEGEVGGLRMGDLILIVRPVGAVESYGPFRWERVPEDVRVRLRIFDADGDALPDDGLVVDPEGENTWSPGLEVMLPSAIRWVVELYDVSSDDNLVATSGFVDASLLPGGR